MRKASKTGNMQFPYADPTVCYIGVTPTGTVEQIKLADIGPYLQQADAGELKLYGVWPGKNRSDLFEIDEPKVAYEVIRRELG